MVYFAQAREAAGRSRERLELAGSPKVAEAFSRALSLHPGLKKIENVIKIAVNEEITSENVSLRNGDRVALLPPVAGG
ncbi:MAG TPA: MoaD/ThiS family protein [Nitrososphaerales archaeon]|nr:MoaD/ThiS family protein [Nitrososphaerales archaeon]